MTFHLYDRVLPFILQVEEEKMGDEWNAMINAEEKNEHVKRDSDVYDYDSRDPRIGGYPGDGGLLFCFVINV